MMCGRRIRPWIPATAAAITSLLLSFPCSAQNVAIVTQNTDVPLSGNRTELHMTLDNHSSQSVQLRLRPPHAARMDEIERTYVPMRNLPQLEVRMDELTATVEAGEKKDLTVQLSQRTPMLAGRYKLMFVAEDAHSREQIATGAAYFSVAPQVTLGAAQMVNIDPTGDPSGITAMVRFSVAANVRCVRVAVVSGDLLLEHRDRSPIRLRLEQSGGAELICRGRLKPDSAMLRFSADTGTLTVAGSQTQWIELTSAMTDQGMDDDLFVRLRWKHDARAPLPAGRYGGQVQLLVIPVLER